MAKQKSKGWLDKFDSAVSKTDATRVNRQLIPLNAKKVTQKELDEREAQARRDRIKVANSAKPQMWKSPENFAAATNATGDKLRVSEYPNVFDDYFNAASMFGHLGSGLGQVPLNIQEGNYGQAAMNVATPLVGGAVEQLLAPIISKGVKSGRTAIDQNFTQVGRQLSNIEKEGIAKGLSPHEISKQQMQQVGITSAQRKAYVPGVSEVVSEYITPYSYEKPVKRILDIPRRIIQGEKNSKRLSDVDANFIFDFEKNNLVAKPRQDAWRMYSGLPQEHDTFRLAETSPINHPSYSNQQLANLEKFSLNDERKLLRDLPNEHEDFRYLYDDPEQLVEAIPHLESKLQNIQNLKNGDIDVTNDFTDTNVMGGYNRRFYDGKMDYNDIWDLDLNGTKVNNYFGKPFMSHGQLDYSFKPGEDAIKELIRKAKYQQELPKNIKNKKIKWLDVDYSNTNTLNPLNIKNVTVTKKYKSGGWLDKYNDGGPVQPNYNDYSVSAPEGYVGDGTFNKGRDYSPAWGGQFKPGGKIPFEKWYKTVPKDKNDTTNYNLRRAYELAPQKELDAFVKNPNAHLMSAYENPQTGIYEFMKSKHHSTINKELDWYNSKGGKDFRNKYDLDTSGDFYRYVPKQFAMGGSMPGAVGFMYARTQDPAPSNGKYAKKTKASAENGTEMSYYQNGLDFKPKSMADGGTTNKKKPIINLGDLTMTPEELEYVNASNSGYCPGGNCLQNTRKGYDMTAGRIPGIPSSGDIWTKDLQLISTKGTPSEKLIKENPYFRGDDSFGSADSWDIHGAIVKAGGKNIYSQAKGQALPKDIAIGSIVGWGPSDTRESSHSNRSKGMNKDYGLQPSHHSTQVVSYDEKGEPIVYDSYLGKYGTLSNISKDLKNSLGYELENISVPKSVAGNTRENLAKKGLLKNELTPYVANIDKLIGGTKQGWAQIKEEDGKMRSPNVDRDALSEFAKALSENKGELVSSLRLSNADYDRLANTALALAMTESEGGGALGFSDRFGSTQGMTQLNVSNIKNDARLKSALDKQYRSKVSATNLLSPASSAISTMMYLSVAEKDAKRLYDKGLKPGVKTFNQPGFIENFRSSNSRLNKDGVFIDELNKRIPYSEIPGYDDEDVTQVNDYLKKITKSDRYNFVNKGGDLTLKMKTKGNNPKLTDIEKIGYMWQSPNSLKTGDAEGKSEYVNKVKNYFNLLNKKMEQGGQLTKLDQLTNFTNYNKPTKGGWLDKYQ